ncbi:TlpA family protein disulfide reductase [Virgibacillus sp. NKC19-3]|uniref:TlpA family protein disulfide reductase n=1 Tax=Virgibacillus saliphilus TaxID=2831674 RepID=UPI001C9A74B1|nr:TlpA disulfide reductase family protein [Virgibacillus sp. NKC19-3]MBY7143569.1 TlpA family protein disulfide reductase [Virgibacillus sp. NKC19-3]MBY7145174.1 TlpA family protein disulfide reductase [Virgibacillus sp. NKC19-3]
MYKKILSIVGILVLAGIVVFNFIQQNNETQTENAPNEYNVSGDSDVEGAAITPPGSTEIEQGESAPEFEMETLDGEKITLSELKGKKVILNFWATWCPPCRDEMPEMQKFHEAYGDEVEILAVNLTDTETSKQDVVDYRNEYEYTYTIPLDTDSTVSDDYKAITVPTTYFVGTDGTIQAPRKVGPMTYDFMEETINSIN